jgi:hypothetical protein
VRACDAVQFQTVTVAKSVAQFVRTNVEFSDMAKVKGQLFSKGLFGILNSSKKQTKKL